MTSYDDMTAGADALLYMGKYDPFHPDFMGLSAFKLWNFSLKAAPKDGVTLAHSKTIQHTFGWDKDAKKYGEAEKSATKLGMKHGDVQIDLCAANDKYSGKVGMPLLDDDWKVEGSAEFEHKTAKQMRKGVVAFGVDSPDMDGTKLNMNLSFE